VFCIAKTNKHIILGLRKKIAAMAEEIQELRIELSKEEEKVFVLEKKLEEKMNMLICLTCREKNYSVSEMLRGGGNRASRR
tara:strand:- start:523 stop:765 length:243 start_codon:yes stop_codon:yes gene_type:complete